MSKLPPLQVPKKPVGLSSQTGTVAVGDLPEGVPGKVEIGSLAKQTAELLQVLHVFCCHCFFRSVMCFFHCLINIKMEHTQ